MFLCSTNLCLLPEQASSAYQHVFYGIIIITNNNLTCLSLCVLYLLPLLSVFM